MVLAVVKCILTVQCIALNSVEYIKHSVLAKSMKYLQNTLSATFSVYILFCLTPAAVGEWLGRSSHNRATRVRDSLEAMDFFNLNAVVSFSSITIFRKKCHQRNEFIRNRRAKTPLIESTFFVKKSVFSYICILLQIRLILPLSLDQK